MINNEDGSVSFTISKEEWAEYEKWEKTLPKLENGHFGAVGGGTRFEFTPTGIGLIVGVRRMDKKKKHYIDITDFSHW